MQIQIREATSVELHSLRTRMREEANCQIVHDSIHAREGWTTSYEIELDDTTVGFGSIAIAGPWKDKPTIFEFYLVPEYRSRTFKIFEAFLQVSGGRFFEVQSNDTLLAAMLFTYGKEIVSESIVFRDDCATYQHCTGARLCQDTPDDDIQCCIQQRRGGGEWHLEFEGQLAAKGGGLFHYNRPYGDIYLEVIEPFRRRGLGVYLVQELKRECYRLGVVPGARCNPGNFASRRTLQRAGFVPFAHILDAVIPQIST